MTDRELMQQALDALEEAQDYTSCPTYSPSMTQQCATAAVALRARLANEFNPDWDAMAVMVEEQQRMAKRIEELEAALAQPEQEIDPDRPHVEEDGCPTEKAVLQRFWREHHAQPKREPVAWMYDWYDETEDIDGVPIGGIVSDCISKDYDEAHSPTMGCHNIRPLYTAPPQQPERKLWLWKNFVDGRPEYWAFDNPYPTNLDNGDPQTLGQPCGYAIFKPSRDGSRGRTEEQVLREMESVSARSEREWQRLTDEEKLTIVRETDNPVDALAATETKLREKNHAI